MRLPHEKYIQFLITTGLDSQGTNDHLKDLGLPPCLPAYWDQQYELLHQLPIPKKVKKYWDNPALEMPAGYLEYMAVVDVKEAWLYNCGRNKAFSNAVDLLKDPDIWIAVRALLALKTNHEEVAALVSSKFVVNCSKESVAIFEKYFYNAIRMKRSEVREYLASIDSEERKILFLGHTGQGILLRMELGFPNRISIAEHYQKLHIAALNKFETYRNASDPKNDAMALKWAQMAMTSGDKYEKLKVSDASDFGRDLQMEFEHVAVDFPMIGEDDLMQIQENKAIGQNPDMPDALKTEG